MGYSEQDEGCTAADGIEFESTPGPAAGDGWLGGEEMLAGAASRDRMGVAAGRQKGFYPEGPRQKAPGS